MHIGRAGSPSGHAQTFSTPATVGEGVLTMAVIVVGAGVVTGTMVQTSGGAAQLSMHIPAIGRAPSVEQSAPGATM